MAPTPCLENALDFLYIVEHPRFRTFYNDLPKDGYLIASGDSSTTAPTGDLLPDEGAYAADEGASFSALLPLMRQAREQDRPGSRSSARDSGPGCSPKTDAIESSGE